MTTAPTTTTAWDQFWDRVGSEDWLTAKALIELSWDLRSEAETWLASRTRDTWDDDGNVSGSYTEIEFDWPEWVADVDERGRSWCSSAGRLFEVVASVLDPERQLRLSVLGYMGSWETDVWRILTEWGTGGNNREHAGRATVVTR